MYVRISCLQRAGFILNPVVVEKCPAETTRYTLFIVRVQDFQILLAISIVQEVFLWITHDRDIAKRLV